MKFLFPSFVALASLINNSYAYTSAACTSKLPSFLSRTFTGENRKLVNLSMIRRGGLEIREEGATPTGKLTMNVVWFSACSDEYSHTYLKFSG